MPWQPLIGTWHFLILSLDSGVAHYQSAFHAGVVGPGAVPEDDQAVTIELTGSPGASVHGAYIADGNRSEFSAALPVKFQIHGITLFGHFDHTPKTLYVKAEAIGQ